MSETVEQKSRAGTNPHPNWSAVFAVVFHAACLITVEFPPVSLLMPMAQDLGIFGGVAGQSVTATVLAAMFASLFVMQAVQMTDRRYVVILFLVLLTLSCPLVSFTNSFSLLLVDRAYLGLALGGFWAMSVSPTMRLVPARTVPKMLSVIFGMASTALVIVAPLRSFSGGIISQRNVLDVAAVTGVLYTIWVVRALLSPPDGPSHQKQSMSSLLQRPGVMVRMTAIFMSFAGQSASFTCIRPIYVDLAGFDIDGLMLVLLGSSTAGFVGTLFLSIIPKHSVKLALAGTPLVLALSVLVLILWDSDRVAAAGIMIIWGPLFVLVPIGWSTWIIRSLADQVEEAGSVWVAVIQLANICGVAVGGYALDIFELLSPPMISGSLMLLTALLVAAKVRIKDIQ